MTSTQNQSRTKSTKSIPTELDAWYQRAQDLGLKPTRRKDQTQSLCFTGHDKKTHSLIISIGDSGVAVASCFGKCATERMSKTERGVWWAALVKFFWGVTINGREAPSGRKLTGDDRFERIHDWYSQTGETLLAQKCKYKPGQVDANGEPQTWTTRYMVKGNVVYTKPKNFPKGILYNWSAVDRAIVNGDTIHVAEGEKDCDRLIADGFVATCNIEGAGSWKKANSKSLYGAHRVIVHRDNDGAGDGFQKAVLTSTASYCMLIGKLELPDLEAGEDYSDWRDSGHTVAELRAVLSKITEWIPDGADLDYKRDYHSAIWAADQFEEFHGDNFLCVARSTGDMPTNFWYCWDGTRYALAERQQVSRAWRELIDHWLTVALNKDTSDADKDKRIKAAAHFSKGNNVRSAMYFLGGLCAVTDADLNPDGHLLNTPGAIVDLRTGERITENRKSYRMTYVTAGEYVPGILEDTPNNLWLPTVREILDNHEQTDDELTEKRGFVKRFAGYSATGSTKEDKALFLIGRGRNGKNTIAETCARVLGDYGRKVPASLFRKARGNTEHPTVLATLQDVRFGWTSEVGSEKELDEEILRRVTSDDMLTSRKMHRDYADFQSTATLWVLNNEPLKIDSQVAGTWTKILLLYLVNTYLDPDEMTARRAAGENLLDEHITERDPGLRAELYLDEADVILTWIIEGAIEWYQDGLKIPQEILADVGEYKSDEDVLLDFTSQYLIRERGARFTFADAWTCYRHFSYLEGWKKPRYSQKRFSGKFTERGYKRTRDSGPREFVGGYLDPALLDAAKAWKAQQES